MPARNPRTETACARRFPRESHRRLCPRCRHTGSGWRHVGAEALGHHLDQSQAHLGGRRVSRQASHLGARLTQATPHHHARRRKGAWLERVRHFATALGRRAHQRLARSMPTIGTRVREMHEEYRSIHTPRHDPPPPQAAGMSLSRQLLRTPVRVQANSL